MFKISLWQKVCFGLVTSGAMIISHIINNGLLKFYTDMIGMSGELYGIAWLFFAIYNTINDPIIGYVSDKRQYSLKKGKRRFYIRRAIPMIFLGLIIVTLVNPVWNAYFTLFILIIGLCVYDTGIATLALNIEALKNVITTDSNERASINMVMIYVNLIPGVLAGLIPYILTNDYSVKMVRLLFVLFSLFGFLMSIIGGYFLKEPMFIYKEELKKKAENEVDTNNNSEIKFSLKPFFSAFESKSFRYFAIANLIISIPISAYYGNIIYYFDDVMVVEDLILFGFTLDANSMPFLVMGTVGLMMPAIYPLYYKLGKKIEHRKIVMAGLSVSAVCYIGLFFADHFLIMTLLYLFIMFGIGTFWLFSTIILADSIDEYQLRTGKRKDGVFLGMNSIITTPAFSIMTYIFGKTLDFYGYDGTLSIQSPDALLGIRLGNGLIPAFFLIVGVIVFYFYPLKGDDLRNMKKEFRERFTASNNKSNLIEDNRELGV